MIRQFHEFFESDFWRVFAIWPCFVRVRCHRCQEGSILIHRDPCGWSDVLDQPGRIMGHCLSGKCSSDGNEDSQAEFSKNLFKIRNQNKHNAHPGTSFYVNFLGCLGSNGFQLK